MAAAEQQLAAVIASSCLSSRGDRIACDLGLVKFREVNRVLIAEVGDGTYETAIVVTKGGE